MPRIFRIEQFVQSYTFSVSCCHVVRLSDSIDLRELERRENE